MKPWDDALLFDIQVGTWHALCSAQSRILPCWFALHRVLRGRSYPLFCCSFWKWWLEFWWCIADYQGKTEIYHDTMTPLVTKLKPVDQIMIYPWRQGKLLPKAEGPYELAEVCSSKGFYYTRHGKEGAHRSLPSWFWWLHWCVCIRTRWQLLSMCTQVAVESVGMCNYLTCIYKALTPLHTLFQYNSGAK